MLEMVDGGINRITMSEYTPGSKKKKLMPFEIQRKRRKKRNYQCITNFEICHKKCFVFIEGFPIRDCQETAKNAERLHED